MNWKTWKADPAEPLKRVDAIDLFKFLVLFFMIQGHLFRAYLLPTLRQAGWYGTHEIFHGIVAPGFLFSAGFAAFLSFFKKREQYTFRGRAFSQRLRRILFVVGIGYWVHLPFLSALKIIRELPTGRSSDFLRVDILQCIGVGLLLFLVLATALRGSGLLLPVIAGLGMAFFLLPQQVKSIPLPFGLKAYFSHEISNFPLFPWAGFLLAGTLVAYGFTRLQPRIFFRILLAGGLLTFPLYFFLRPQGLHKAELTLTGNLTKLGGVLLLLCLSQLVCDRVGGKLVGIMKRAGKESLFVYVLHLFLIFGSFMGMGLKPLFQDSLGVLPALALFLPLQLGIFALSLLYGTVKEKKPRLWRIGFILFWTGFFLAMIIRTN